MASEEDSEEQVSLNTEGDNNTTNVESSEAILVSLVHDVTQQLFQLETLVKNTTQVSNMEEVYENM